MGVAVTTKHYQGGCLCGWIRFRAAAPADNPHACSCKNCQRHTGALSAVWLEFPRDRVEWTGPGGAPAVYRSSAYSSRAFCARCGSSVGAIDDAPTIALLLGGLDDCHPPELAPAAHAFADGKPAWWREQVDEAGSGQD
nr:GFA family protein [Chromobacterium alkanivorans]